MKLKILHVHRLYKAVLGDVVDATEGYPSSCSMKQRNISSPP